MKSGIHVAHYSFTWSALLWTMCFSSILLLMNCNSGKSPSTSTDSLQAWETKIGLASFYGRAFEGKETASGEVFDKEEMVAAHPTYPLGTIARITNMEEGGSVEVRIIDRGPTDENVAEGVIIDLSKGAATKLGMVEEGRIKVKVEVLQWGTDERK